MNQSLTFYEGAIWVLWNNPDVWLSSAEIWNNLKDAGLVKTKGDTPWQTMNQSIRSNLKYFNEKTSGAGPYSLSDDGKRYYESSVRFKVEEFNKDDNTSTEIVATNDMINEITEYLKANHNIILHGAPGTGKTWLAKEIAKAMCKINTDDELKKSEQFKMVQFHPSYDYTDFVEGLRPKSNEKGEIVFERKDGVFKTFCKKAVSIQPKQISIIEDFDEVSHKQRLKQAWDIILGEINNRGEDGLILDKIRKGQTTSPIRSNEDQIVLIKNKGTNEPEFIRFDCIEKFFNRKKYCIEEIKNIKQEELKDIMWCKSDGAALIKHIADIYRKQTASNIRVNGEPSVFVFLIDEINRGDLSKIFGELFFSIDPGYRGEKGKIDTQYQNLVGKEVDENGKPTDKDDTFKGGFYIPDNVYIIGTMNDIDRSVESMDFAMRRRFQFIEVTAESRAEGMGLVKKNADGKITTTTEAYKRMTNLNNCISGKVEDGGIGLSSAYHIGGSYFLSEKKDDKGQRNPISSADGFKDLWNYRLEGLLREYLRGEEESIANEKLTKLENAFKQPDVYEYDKDGKLTVVEKKSEEAAPQQNGDSPKNSTKAE